LNANFRSFPQLLITYSKTRCYEATKLGKIPIVEFDLGLEYEVPEVSSRNDDSEGQRTLCQYVSIILIVQALSLWIPFFLWKLGEKRLGIHFIVGAENPGEDSKYVGKRMAVYLEQWIKNRKINILSLGTFTFFHFFIKLLYFVSMSTHYVLLDGFLRQDNDTSYGTQLLRNLKENNFSVFQTSPAFPHNVQCSYMYVVYYVGHQYSKDYTVQCSLPLNPYLEMIMPVVWCWLVFSMAVIVADGVFYFLGAVIPYFRVW
jgi:hypothetical protein